MSKITDVVIADDPFLFADAYLSSPVVAFDVETDTDRRHWQNNSRGLSVCADVTFLSLASPGLPALVFKAQPHPVRYAADVVENGEVVQREFDAFSWRFSDREIAFFRQLFSSEKTFVAHNLVFDARQVYLKFGASIHPNAVFYDTQVIALTGGWVGEVWEGVEDDDSDQPDQDDPADDFENADDPAALRGEALDLLTLSRHLIDPEIREWWEQMKKHRAVFSRMILDPVFALRRGVSRDALIRYSALDSVVALALRDWQLSQPREPAVLDTVKFVQLDSLDDRLRIDLDYTRLCVEMSVKGIKFDLARAHQQRAKYLELWKQSLAGFGLTPDQGHLPRQKKWQMEYVFSRIDQPPPDEDIALFKLKTAKGAWSFSKSALAYYLKRYPELLAYKRHVAIETKLRRLDEFIRHAEFDGRIHSVLSRVALTGRNTSSSPNIQNLQMKLKDVFEGAPEPDVGLLIPDEPDLVFISLDCSNAENWMGAMMARDDKFALACASADFHSMMAAAYFPEFASADPDRKKQLRTMGKAITFGTAYGMGQEKLARTLGVTQERAQDFLRSKDAAFPRVAYAKSAWTTFAERQGYAVLWTGRRVKIRSQNGRYKGYTAWNSLAQGGVGELIVRGMLACRDLFQKRSPRSRVVSQVHDEIVLQIDPADYPGVVQDVIERLASVVPDLWNSRTQPACRWLFDLDVRANVHKWGERFDGGTQLPDHFINRWGVHEYPDGATECPVWINRHGFGESALAHELPIKQKALDMPSVVDYNDSIGSKKSFDWDGLVAAILAARDVIAPVTYKDRVFAFSEGIELLRTLAHEGDPGSAYTAVTEVFDRLALKMAEYAKWRQEKE